VSREGLFMGRGLWVLQKGSINGESQKENRVKKNGLGGVVIGGTFNGGKTGCLPRREGSKKERQKTKGERT